MSACSNFHRSVLAGLCLAAGLAQAELPSSTSVMQILLQAGQESTTDDAQTLERRRATERGHAPLRVTASPGNSAMPRICDRVDDVGCLVPLRPKDDPIIRLCKDRQKIHVWGNRGTRHTFDPVTEGFLLVPVYEHPADMQRVPTQQAAAKNLATGGSSPIEMGRLQVHWECGSHQENQRLDLPLATQFIKVYHARVGVGPVDGRTPAFMPYAYRPADHRHAEDGGSYARNGDQWSERCSKSEIRVYGRGGVEYRVPRGLAAVVPLDYVPGSRNTRWECGGYNENQTLNYPEGTDALLVNNIADSRRINFVPLVWHTRQVDLLSDSGAARPAAGSPRRFANPSIDGKRLDWCLQWGRNCGKAAADAFCRENHYASAQSFNIARDIGDRIPTFVLADRRMCNERACDGFAQITCE